METLIKRLGFNGEPGASLGELSRFTSMISNAIDLLLFFSSSQESSVMPGTWQSFREPLKQCNAILGHS